MKTLTHKKSSILIIPVLILIILGLIARDKEPRLVLVKSHVDNKTYADGIQYKIIKLTLKYNDHSLFNRLFKNENREGPNLSEINYSLIDQQGNRHQISKFGMWSNQLSKTAQQGYDVLIDIPIGKIPKSWGEIILVTEFSTVDGIKLPFSVVVREK